MKELSLMVVLMAATFVAGYDNCWDGTYAVHYTGTVSVTRTGRVCQNWADDLPHLHNWHGSSPLFPHDGDDAAAQNYCRDPNGGSGSSGTWCFTMDPGWSWDYCDIDICTNLPCTSGDIVGQSTPASFAASTDTVGGTNYLLDDGGSDTYRFPCCGTVSEWRLYLTASGTIRLQVWRLDSDTGSHVLIGENVATPSAGDVTVSVSQTDRISFEEGDLIGWYADSGLVTYSAGTTDNNRLLTTAAPSVGDSVSFAAATPQDSRDYAIGLVVAKSLAPSFSNSVTLVDILETAAVGSPVFTLIYTDSDPDDVATLALTMATNTYFELSGDDVVVKTNLTVTIETLDITVTDHCGETGVYTLTVNVTEVPVTITNLPDSINVSESTTAQTLLHTIIVSPTGSDTYTCNIDSYLPTRAEGNPFLIANTPTADNSVYLAIAAYVRYNTQPRGIRVMFSQQIMECTCTAYTRTAEKRTIHADDDNGVYLAIAANVRYNTATQLNVTVTCTNSGATDSDTSYLVVNIDPNAHPQFDSFVNSATFSARSTAINDVVYTATVSDAENDPITMSLTCDPTSCPFDVDNAGNVYATSGLSLHQETTYTIILAAFDGFNSVESSNISFVLSDINVLPVFTNLPGAATDVDENQAVGTSVFQASGTDANGDSFTYSATYSDPDCAAMYDIDSAGLVTTKIIIDYESLTATTMPCELYITAFDGYGTTDAANLTVNVADVDEPPEMSGSAFTITTPEVTDNTALPDQSISATDPEGGAVALSLDCGSDNGHLDIQPFTGIVTMTTAFDLEFAGVDTYTILCTITATDASSLTSTSYLTVVVTDANDESPVFVLGGYSATLVAGYSNYATVLTVSATDDDRTSPNNLITYSLSPTTQFNVDASGNIYNTADLSAVTDGTVYSLTVTATDGGAPPLTDTAPVTIYITSSTTTATTTTTTTTAATNSGSVDASVDFWSSTGNIVLLALVCFLVLLVSAVLGVLLWKYCRKHKYGGRFRPDKPKQNPQTKASEVAPEKPKHKIQNEMRDNKTNNQKPDNNAKKTTTTPNPSNNNSSINVGPRSNPALFDDDSLERAQNYHRPRGPLKEVARGRFRPMPSPGGMGQGVPEWPERVVTPRNVNFSVNDI